MTLERTQALPGDLSRLPASEETSIEVVTAFVPSHLNHMEHQALGRYILVVVVLGEIRVYQPHSSDEHLVSP